MGEGPTSAAVDRRRAGRWTALAGDRKDVRVALGESFHGVLCAARAGQEWAWEAIYRDLSPAVAGYLRAKDGSEPDDLTAEVFLQLVRDIRRFEGGESEFRAWALKIAHNRLVDQHRRLRCRPTETVLVEEIEAGEAGGNVEEEALAIASENRVHQLLGHLTEDQQSVLLLRIVGDLTVAQVATVLGRNRGAVKALQRRGLATLRRKLSKLGVTS